MLRGLDAFRFFLKGLLYTRCTVPRTGARGCITTVDPMLLPSGNPFECHGEVLYLQPMNSISQRFDIFPRLGNAQKV